MNVLITLKAIFLYMENLFYLKGFDTECAPYFCKCLSLTMKKEDITHKKVRV